MMQWKSILPLVAIFLLGMVAGCGIGAAYGQNAYNAQLEQKVADLENRFQTVNDNYMILVREYNKLFSLRASSGTVSTVPLPSPAAVTPKPGVTADPRVTPTVATKPTIVPTAAKPAVATVAPTAAPKSSGGKPKAEFKALAIDGTGPLEGVPPLVVKFTDLSTGEITSWKWDFGDKQTSITPNPEHTFEECPGEKQLCTIKLTVCGPGGCDTIVKPDYIWVSASCSGC
jgi:PKD repeat protein